MNTAEDIEGWLVDQGLPGLGADATPEAASELIAGLEGDESVEHFNFYGPLSQFNQYRAPDEGVQEQAQEQTGRGQSQGRGNSPK